MKYTTITLLLALISLREANAQTIYGQIKDDKNTSLEFINVILFTTKDTSLVKAAVSNSEGFFIFENMPIGNYFVRTNFIGYNDWTSQTISITNNENIDLGNVALLPTNNETSTVNVVYKKPLVQVEADKTIFNVEGTINSAGLNALELLRKAPGVMLDNDDNISIKGRSGITVYIDGKRSPLDADGLKAYLRNMQSSNIESIEIITNPSAKYDASGTAGIINIKLKKNKNFGTNGSVQVGYGVQIYSKYNGSLNINHRNKHWNLFGTYSYNDGKSFGWMDLTRTQLNPSDSLEYLYEQKTRNTDLSNGHNYKAGADYYLNDKNTIGVMVSGSSFASSSLGTSNTYISVLDEIVKSTLESKTKSESNRSNINGNINYHFSDSTGKDFTTDIDYGYYDISSKTYQPNTYRYPNSGAPDNNINYRFITPVQISIIGFKSDYEQKLLGGTFGTGVKFSYVQTDNTLNRYNIYPENEILDSLRSNSFAYNENINAAYVSFKKQQKKFSYQLGLRAEQTVSEGNLQSFVALSDESNRSVSRNYLNFFPSGGITYSINDTNQFSLTASRRIDRPSYQDLNPFESKLDELSYQRGNPFLQPQYGHVAELTYTYLYALNASVTYSFTKDFFTNITDTANGNANYIMNKNLGYEEWVGFNLSSPIPLGKKLNAFVNLNTGRKRIHADFNDINLKIWGYSFFAQMSYSFPKSITAELSGWYSGPSIWGATFVTKPMGSMDAAVKKDLWQGRANLRIALSDVLYTNIWHSNSRIAQLQINGAGGWESRQFRVSFTYNFGNQQMNNRQRKTSADDLKDRVK